MLRLYERGIREEVGESHRRHTLGIKVGICVESDSLISFGAQKKERHVPDAYPACAFSTWLAYRTWLLALNAEAIAAQPQAHPTIIPTTTVRTAKRNRLKAMVGGSMMDTISMKNEA